MATGFRQLTDTQWKIVLEGMDWKPPLQRKQPRADIRTVWNSIFYVLSRGCRWADLPEDRKIYASRPVAHRWFQIWRHEGVFDRVLSYILQVAISEGKVDLSQLAVDGSFSPYGLGRRGDREGL